MTDTVPDTVTEEQLNDVVNNLNTNIINTGNNITNNLIGTINNLQSQINQLSLSNISLVNDFEESNNLLRLQSELQKEENAKTINFNFQSKIIFNDQITPKKTESVIVVSQGDTNSCDLSPITYNLANSINCNMLFYRAYGYDSKYSNGIEQYSYHKDIEKFEEYITKYALQIGNKIIFYGMSFGCRFVLTSLPKFKSSISNIILNSPFFKLPEPNQTAIIFTVSDEDFRNLALSDKWYTILEFVEQKFPSLLPIFRTQFPEWPYRFKISLQQQLDSFPISRISTYDFEEELGIPASYIFHYIYVYLYESFVLKRYENSFIELNGAGIRVILIGDIRDTIVDEKYNREECSKFDDFHVLKLEENFDTQGEVTIDNKQYNLDQLNGYKSYSIYGNTSTPNYHSTGAGYKFSVATVPLVSNFIYRYLK